MADDDEYSQVARGKLKLKVNMDLGKKKKKKKNKDKDKEKAAKALEQHLEEQREIANRSGTTPAVSGKKEGRPLTQAEKKFKEQQEKMQTKRILEKASLTHKQRVEKFNQHLDSLTEHFDIPKVSWTK